MSEHSELDTVQTIPLAGAIGAEIKGVNAASASDYAVAAVREALHAFKVVFLRDQALNYETQVAFARNFGPLTPGHPIFAPVAAKPHLREMDSSQGSRANYWHTDLTFVQAPPAYCFLHGIAFPASGGDTMWANMAAAYDALPAPLRSLADQLRIIHSNNSDYTDATVVGRRDYIQDVFEAEHSAVRVHPVTGEPALMLGGFAQRVSGLMPRDSRDLLRILQDHSVRPEFTVRWSWRPGDLAIWDNSATQHYAISDYGTQYRRAERVTVAGEVPVGLDGVKSVALQGKALDFEGLGH